MLVTRKTSTHNIISNPVHREFAHHRRRIRTDQRAEFRAQKYERYLNAVKSVFAPQRSIQLKITSNYEITWRD